MPLFLTASNLPELAPFRPPARHFLLQCAFQIMYRKVPRLRWITWSFGLTGVAVGLGVASALPGSIYELLDDSNRTFYPSVLMAFCGVIGAAVGLQIMIRRARPFLRSIIDSHEGGPL